MTCDDGTQLVVNLRNRNQRVEMNLLVTGPIASPPSGYLDVGLTNHDTGAFVNGFGSIPGALVSESITNLGAAVPAGPLALDFHTVVHEGGVITGAALVTCVATIVTSAK